VEISFKAKLWIYSGTNPWHFLTLPKKSADQVREVADLRPRRGFGSLRVLVKIGENSWQTSIFPDSDSGSYILPVKKSIRTQEGLLAGDLLKTTITLID